MALMLFPRLSTGHNILGKKTDFGTSARVYSTCAGGSRRPIPLPLIGGTTSADAEAFRFVDLFAGIGGIRLGLEAVGGRCVYSVEIDRFARKTYEANFGECEGSDVRLVQDLPNHEVLAAGFPCQPFSIAGVSKKLSLGREHGFRDTAQGNLFFEIARLLQVKQPPVILLENVKNLVSHDGGRTFRIIMSSLDKLGYEVVYKIIDARHWVPQHRERTFIIGFHRRVYSASKFVFPDEPTGNHRLSAILDSDFDSKYMLSPHLWTYLQRYARKHKSAGNGFGFGLFGPNDVARTLSARYYKDGSEILIQTRRPQPRRLTPRECARLMGFPDDFKIVVSDTQAYRQFGNAVVVPVISHLGQAIVRQARFSRQRQLRFELQENATYPPAALTR
jgi:DNA (cytosine-5)-methyltransferase 1